MPSSIEPAQNIQHSFQAFLWKHLDLIDEAWDRGAYDVALRRAIRLCYYLPKEVKEKLQKQQKELVQELKLAYVVPTSSFHTSQVARTQQINTTSMQKLPDFVNHMTTLLDQRGYLEQKPMRPRYKESKRLEV